MNFVSYHGSMKKPNSTVILVCRYRLVNHNLTKGFVVLEDNSKQLSSVMNDVKLIIHVIDQLEHFFFNTAISSVRTRL